MINHSKINGGCYELLSFQTMVLILCFERYATTRKEVLFGPILELAGSHGSGIVCSIVCMYGSRLLFRLLSLQLDRILFLPVFILQFVLEFYVEEE